MKKNIAIATDLALAAPLYAFMFSIATVCRILHPLHYFDETTPQVFYPGEGADGSAYEAYYLARGKAAKRDEWMAFVRYPLYFALFCYVCHFFNLGGHGGDVCQVQRVC